MESLSSVPTIMRIVQDILSAVETASRNKSRCKKVAKRARCIKDILEALDDGTATPTPTRSMMMDRLKEALSDALLLVRQCQRSSLLRSVIVDGKQMAELLDDVEREIDKCILDLTFANSLRIAGLETLVRQHNMADNTEKDENKRRKSPDEKVDQVPMAISSGRAQETAAAIGVPVYTVTTASVPVVQEEHKHGYGYWPNHVNACNCCGGNAHGGGPSSDAASYYHSQYSSYPSVFSDDNPNSCIIM